MTYVCVACVRGKFWKSQTKWYGSDNTNTVGWIRDRYATNPIAQFLLRVLGIAEATWRFDSYAAFIRTYHNVIPDDLKREAWRQAQTQLESDGFTRVEIGDAWKFYLPEVENAET